MTARTQVRLSLYERGIAESLVSIYDYSAVDSRKLVVEYIEVMRKLGGYESCGHYAMLLDRARRLSYPPAQWLERISEIERGETRDRGIGSEEQQYLQTR